jgi:fructose-1,6-bisphosphatase/inositol monophosphatase family enzyme
LTTDTAALKISVHAHTAENEVLLLPAEADYTKDCVAELGQNDGVCPFGTMVVLVERGVLLASAIFLLEGDRMYLAARGLGAFCNGVRITSRTATTARELTGSLYVRYMPEDLAAALTERAALHQQVPGVICAAHEYTQIASGNKDYVHYYRLLPWDHAPGALIVREAGGVVRHPDGRECDIFDTRESTLLAPDEPTWELARRELFGD